MKRALLLLAPLVALLAPRVAYAIDCTTLPNPIFLRVGDTQDQLMRRLGRKLRDNAPRPITLVWVTSGSCTNITHMYTGVPIPSSLTTMPPTIFYAPSIAENATYVPSQAPPTCTIAVDRPLDIANSALFNSACTTDAPPATVHLTQGPIQAYVMAVPEASSQTAITLQEAFFVFGYGMGGMISPWTDEAQMFIRKDDKSTLLAWAANLGIPVAKWKGIKYDKSGEVVTALLGTQTPEKAIGLLGAEVYDANRATLNVLAYRAKEQYAAYYPDSTSSTRDKQNVRDGHYTVWSPTVWMDKVTGTTPDKPDARYVIDLITKLTVIPEPNFDMQAIIAAVGLVPDCAMKVARSFEGGPLSLYTPTESCTCKYESLVQTTSCAICDAGTPCASGVCRNGFCEVR